MAIARAVAGERSLLLADEPSGALDSAGMPLIGAIAGWLLGGRAPSAISRQPLE